jgi:hypothetical protein
VLDPFQVKNGWFTLDFHSFFVHPNSLEPKFTQDRISQTIAVLKLNDDNWVGMRFAIVRDYSRQYLSFAYLQERYPFIGFELLRQGLRDSILGTLP